MANLVSIDWSIEEFRRLISEPPQSGKAGSSIGTSVDDAAPSSATTDRATPMEDASSSEADAANEGSSPSQVHKQTRDSPSDLMVADVMALTALRAAGSDRAISSPEADRVRDIALDILTPDSAQPPKMPERPLALHAENAVTSEVETKTPDAGADGKETASAAPLRSSVPNATEVPDRPMVAPPIFAQERKVELRLPSLQVVVRPDILAGKVGRERAIELRWVLRDIKGNRLKWSPASEEDLKTLIEFDLVEMKNGLPQLTVAGLDAV